MPLPASMRRYLRPGWILLAVLIVYPFVPLVDRLLFRLFNTALGPQLTDLFIFGILALALNVVVGYTGLLHLGIAAFFGIGAYVTGILTVPSYPFQVGFWPALAASILISGLCGLVLGAPTLRLRGDYLALVTLGFGEVVRYSIRNLEEITNGTRTLGPLPAPVPPAAVSSVLSLAGFDPDWRQDYRPLYLFCLAFLLAVAWMLRNLEASRLGRAWVALREDELATTCMGINAARVKLSAFALGAALAGLAGCLYAVKQSNTAGPDAYDFNRSVTILCCIILGGMGSIRGTLLGVALLIGFDSVLTPVLDNWVQQSGLNPGDNQWLKFSSWRLVVFGLAMILMMRFRPEGLLPSTRVQRELHADAPAPV